MPGFLVRFITYIAVLVVVFLILRVAAPAALRDFFLLLSDLLTFIQGLLRDALGSI